MAQVTITSNADEVALEIAGWDDILEENMEGILKASAKRVQKAAATYPAKPAGSSYNRTGKLGRGWKVGTATQTSIQVGNKVAYGQWVQKAGQQAKRNKHWQTDEEIAKAERPLLEKDLSKGVLDGIK